MKNKEFTEKRSTFREKGFDESIKRSGIQITIVKKRKPREISALKEDQQILGSLLQSILTKI